MGKDKKDYLINEIGTTRQSPGEKMSSWILIAHLTTK